MGHGPGMHGCVDTRLGVDTKTFMRTPHSHTEYQLDMWQITLAFPAFFGEATELYTSGRIILLPFGIRTSSNEHSIVQMSLIICPLKAERAHRFLVSVLRTHSHATKVSFFTSKHGRSTFPYVQGIKVPFRSSKSLYPGSCSGHNVGV